MRQRQARCSYMSIFSWQVICRCTEACIWQRSSSGGYFYCHTLQKEISGLERDLWKYINFLHLETTPLAAFREWTDNHLSAGWTTGEEPASRAFFTTGKKESRKVLSQEVKETEISCATKHGVLVYVSEGNGEVVLIYLKKICGKRHVSLLYLTFSLLIFIPESCVYPG